MEANTGRLEQSGRSKEGAHELIHNGSGQAATQQRPLRDPWQAAQAACGQLYQQNTWNPSRGMTGNHRMLGGWLIPPKQPLEQQWVRVFSLFKTQLGKNSTLGPPGPSTAPCSWLCPQDLHFHGILAGSRWTPGPFPSSFPGGCSPQSCLAPPQHKELKRIKQL